MKKNGFTLIELLAVIVILAIIALIATPIILGIINDARKESQERSIELYASAVRNGIAAYQLREGKEVLADTYGTNNPLPFEVEYDGDVICSTIELYEDGGVYVTGCTVNGNEVDYAYGTKQEKVVKISEICNPATEQLYATNALDSGYKYECDVDPSKEGYDYSFYVLNNDGKTVNLIMSKNLVSSAWINSDDYTAAGGTRWGNMTDQNLYGPITALKTLKENTAEWENLDEYSYELIYGPVTVEEEGKEYNTPYTGEYVQNIMARLPKLSEVEPFKDTTWLYDNLDLDDFDTTYINGYWLSDGANGYGNSSFAWHVYRQEVNDGGYVFEVNDITEAASALAVDESNLLGIRPVITLSI